MSSSGLYSIPLPGSAYGDMANEALGIKKQEADFGQTLGHYGLGTDISGLAGLRAIINP